jgi:malonyl CoA-acyl carrier protein transacylase
VRVLPPGGLAFAAALFSGVSLGEAAALAAADGFDPGAHLVGLIEAGAFQSLISKEFRR